jgi:hypothetical protein
MTSPLASTAKTPGPGFAIKGVEALVKSWKRKPLLPGIGLVAAVLI